MRDKMMGLSPSVKVLLYCVVLLWMLNGERTLTSAQGCSNCGTYDSVTGNCSCPTGYFGDTCQNLCVDQPGPFCNVSGSNITVFCNDETFGSLVRESCPALCGLCVECPDPCPDPCGGNCSACENCGILNPDNCTCTCPEGYYGDRCERVCEDTDIGCIVLSDDPGLCSDPGHAQFARESCPAACGFCATCNGTCPDPCGATTCAPCENCGTLDETTCTCTCPTGYWGPQCQAVCEDIDVVGCVVVQDAPILCSTPGYEFYSDVFCAASCGTCEYCGANCPDPCGTTTPITTTCAPCENCGTLDEATCTCTCPKGYFGNKCQGVCQDVDPACAIVAADPPLFCNDSLVGDFSRETCPVACGVCAGCQGPCPDPCSTSTLEPTTTPVVTTTAGEVMTTPGETTTPVKTTIPEVTTTMAATTKVTTQPVATTTMAATTKVTTQPVATTTAEVTASVAETTTAKKTTVAPTVPETTTGGPCGGLQCENCATLNLTTCTCDCPPGWTGVRCQDKCVASGGMCDLIYNINPSHSCYHKVFGSLIQQNCPGLCGLCTPCREPCPDPCAGPTTCGACDNCGTLVDAFSCVCDCPKGYYGNLCKEECRDADPMCVLTASNPGHFCVDPPFSIYNREFCPLSCGLCQTCNGPCPDPCANTTEAVKMESTTQPATTAVPSTQKPSTEAVVTTTKPATTVEVTLTQEATTKSVQESPPEPSTTREPQETTYPPRPSKLPPWSIALLAVAAVLFLAIPIGCLAYCIVAGKNPKPAVVSGVAASLSALDNKTQARVPGYDFLPRQQTTETEYSWEEVTEGTNSRMHTAYNRLAYYPYQWLK